MGNHDSKLIKNENAVSYFDLINDLLQITDEDKEIVLCHFPLTCWNKEQYGTWHVYGHIHGYHRGNIIEAFAYMKNKERALNAGCMINNYSPALFGELVENNKRYWMEFEKDNES